MKKIKEMNQGSGPMIRLVYHSDAGHGWLAVKYAVLERLGIAENITAWSYAKGATVYLEEDCDAPKLMKLLRERNLAYKVVEGAYKQSSPIRNYRSYVSPKALGYNSVPSFLTDFNYD